MLVVADDPLHAVLTHFWWISGASLPTGLQYCLCVAPTHLTWYTLLNFEVLFEAGTEMCDTMCEADLDYMQAESGAAQTDSSLSVMAFICHLTEWGPLWPAVALVEPLLLPPPPISSSLAVAKTHLRTRVAMSSSVLVSRAAAVRHEVEM